MKRYFYILILPAAVLVASAWSCTVEPTNPRSLILLRHSQSHDDRAKWTDFDRPLSEKGEKHAPAIGRLLRENGIKPDLVICSPALRTRQTAKYVCTELGYDVNTILLDSSIYLCTSEALLQSIQRTDAKYKCVLVIGHNPSTTEVCNLLQSDTVIAEMPTSGALHLQFNIAAWKEAGSSKGKVKKLMVPQK